MRVIHHLKWSEVMAYVLMPDWKTEVWWNWATSVAKAQWLAPKFKELPFEPERIGSFLSHPNWSFRVVLLDFRV